MGIIREQRKRGRRELDDAREQELVCPVLLLMDGVPGLIYVVISAQAKSLRGFWSLEIHA